MMYDYEKYREYQAAYRERHREKRRAYDRERMKGRHRDPEVKRWYSEHAQQRRRLIRGMAVTDGCQQCGSREDLQWHHRDPTTKRLPLSEMVTHSWSAIMDEIDKCTVLCQLCHTEVHSAQR